MSANESAVDTSSRSYEVASDESLSEAIVNAVTDASDRHPVPTAKDKTRNGDPVKTLDPLYRVIDPEALESLFSSNRTLRNGDIEVSFSYHDWVVTVHSYGIIHVEPSPGEASK